MNRAAATDYLADLYGSGGNALLTLADIGLTDAVGGLKVIIDDAALLMGVSYDDLATADVSSVVAYRATLRYVALKRIIAALNAKSLMGVASVGQGVSIDVREWIKRLQGELAIAAAEARAEGVDLPSADGTSSWPASGWALAGINLDYLEPEATV